MDIMSIILLKCESLGYLATWRLLLWSGTCHSVKFQTTQSHSRTTLSPDLARIPEYKVTPDSVSGAAGARGSACPWFLIDPSDRYLGVQLPHICHPSSPWILALKATFLAVQWETSVEVTPFPSWWYVRCPESGAVEQKHETRIQTWMS